MDNTFVKTFLYFLLFSFTIIAGYIVGLISFPMPDRVIAVTASTISIDQAKDTDTSSLENSTTEENNNFTTTREINPFTSGGKIVNIQQPRTDIVRNNSRENNNNQNYASDPRITIIPQNKNNNPLTGTISDTVEIEIPGEEPNASQLSQIEQKKLIDDLSVMDKKDTKKEQINFHDPYAPRKSLIKAPQAGYYENNGFGDMPISPKNAIPLWKKYANATRIASNKKPIALVLGGLGPDKEMSIEAIKTLPSEITLGFVPYTDNLQELVSLAREYGHETILEIPMESHDFPRQDAGVLALKTDDNIDTYQKKLNILLGRASGYSGVMNYLGSKYLLDNKKSTRFLKDIANKGLYYVENKTIRTGLLLDKAKEKHIPYAQSYDTFDEVLSPVIISNILSQIEKNALEGTPIVATGYVSRVTLASLRAKIANYPQNNVQLIPISAYVEYVK